MKNIAIHTAFYQLLPFVDTEHTEVEEIRLPGYSLYEKITKMGPFKKYMLSIYTKNKRKYFAKICETGVTRNMLLLKKEAEVYSIFQDIESYKGVQFPALESFIQDEKYSTLLIEYITGKTLSELSVDEKITILSRSIEYLRSVGKKITKEQENVIGRRTALNEISLFPLLFPFALYRNREMGKLLIQAALKFFTLAPSLFMEKELVLSHRDLHGNNILVNKENVWIFDFENLVFTVPSMEYVVMLLSYWRDKKMRKYLQSIIEKNDAARALVLKMCIHYLTDRNVPYDNRQNYIEAINWVLEES